MTILFYQFCGRKEKLCLLEINNLFFECRTRLIDVLVVGTKDPPWEFWLLAKVLRLMTIGTLNISLNFFST